MTPEPLVDARFSVAMTAFVDESLRAHLDKGLKQEDLTFAYWRPSVGATRTTALINEIVLPAEGDRVLQGNVAFNPQYLKRVLDARPDGAGVAFLHSHLGPGWQGMSHDDIVAERDRLSGPAWGQSGLPVVGLTLGTDGTWSARYWIRVAPREFERHDAESVRVVGRALRVSYHPEVVSPPVGPSQQATVSVWGEHAQGKLARARVGIVGLGSVGSIVAEALARVGFTRITLIDFDVLEDRNRDRTAGATAADVAAALTKVQVATRNITQTATAVTLDVRGIAHSLLEREGLAAALDCDVLISCVDRPWPRFVLNTIAFAHLIPVIDGGIASGVKADGTPLHVDWRIHTVGPDNACMVCQDALRRSDVALDMQGLLDDPEYIRNLSDGDRARFSSRNVFPFSLSVAAHEVLQLVGLLTGMTRVGGTGPQAYHGYPGTMTVSQPLCADDCEFVALMATGADLTRNIRRDPSDAAGGAPSAELGTC
jgi:molybdopterin-synthase adenylyltransferase